MKFIRSILTRLSNILPKFNKTILLPYPDWEDMTLAIFDELIKTKKNKIIWLLNKNSSVLFYKKLFPDTVVVKRSSIKGIFHLFTSKTIYCTHGTFYRWVPKGMRIINLWHGFGFKAVGTYLKGIDRIACTHAISSSNYSRKFISIEMNLTESSVYPLGFPRNDRLLNALNNWQIIKENLEFKNFKKIIIWMPTYRSSIEGDIRKDGIQYDNPFNLEYFDIEEFYKYLFSENILCLFRAHPMSMKFELKQNSNFKLISDKWLLDNGISLYQLLGITDLLISDVSSVITDYLLIDKPIIHAMSDFDNYCANRPLLLSPPRDFLVGPLVKDQICLVDEITLLFSGIDAYKEIRDKLKILFFDENIDNRSTYRVLTHLEIN